MSRVHTIWIAVPILWATMWMAVSGNEPDWLRDLQWISRASVADAKAEIDAGAEPLKPADPLRPGVDKHPGHSPLHFAAQTNPDPSVAALFLELGADLESRSSFADEGTPLHLSAGGWGIRRAEFSAVGRNNIWSLGLENFVAMQHAVERMQ